MFVSRVMFVTGRMLVVQESLPDQMKCRQHNEGVAQAAKSVNDDSFEMAEGATHRNTGLLCGAIVTEGSNRARLMACSVANLNCISLPRKSRRVPVGCAPPHAPPRP